MEFKKLSVVLDQFMHMYPRDISIYIGECIGFCDKKYLNCRFIFSEDGFIRDKHILKKDFQNTLCLYNDIQKEFLTNKTLISLGYESLKISRQYMGIKLQNSQEERLNIYFCEELKSIYQDTINYYKQIKQKDFLEYASNPIKKHVVKKMIIRQAVDNRSGIIYIFNNEEYSSSLLKEKQLGYYYRKKDGIIDKDDLASILYLIRYFINCNLDRKPNYEYRLDCNYKTSALYIKCDSGEKIEIVDNDLIDIIEKTGLIDDLWRVKNQKIDKMPKQKIIKGEIKNGK